MSSHPRMNNVLHRLYRLWASTGDSYVVVKLREITDSGSFRQDRSDCLLYRSHPSPDSAEFLDLRIRVIQKYPRNHTIGIV